MRISIPEKNLPLEKIFNVGANTYLLGYNRGIHTFPIVRMCRFIVFVSLRFREFRARLI